VIAAHMGLQSAEKSAVDEQGKAHVAV